MRFGFGLLQLRLQALLCGSGLVQSRFGFAPAHKVGNVLLLIQLL